MRANESGLTGGSAEQGRERMANSTHCSGARCSGAHCSIPPPPLFTPLFSPLFTRVCVPGIIKEGLNVKESTPLCLEKSLILCKHLVTHGSERSVDLAFDLLPTIEELSTYNSAIVRGAFHKFVGGGVDKGAPVREVAATLVTLLNDDDEIRALRKQHADPDALVPLGDKDDFKVRNGELRGAEVWNERRGGDDLPSTSCL